MSTKQFTFNCPLPPWKDKEKSLVLQELHCACQALPENLCFSQSWPRGALHAGSRWGHAGQRWEAPLPGQVQGMHTHERVHVLSVLSLRHQRAERYCEKMLLWLFHCWSAPLQMGRSIFPVQVLQKLFWLGWFPSCDLCINNSAFLATKTLTLLTITFLLEVCPFL